MSQEHRRPRALLFDVQGTATDFHTTVTEAARELDAGRHPHIDWDDVVTRWRHAYSAALSAHGGRYTPVMKVYRDALDELLAEHDVALSAEERDGLTDAWQQLRPWPDAVSGLERLRRRYTVATLSNADVHAVVNLSKRAGLTWDAVFTAEMAHAFKPDHRMCRMAATYLGLPAERIMMVACHKYDLRAAADVGMATAFVTRPHEFGPHGEVDLTHEDRFTVNATDFADLATRLGC